MSNVLSKAAKGGRKASLGHNLFKAAGVSDSTYGIIDPADKVLKPLAEGGIDQLKADVKSGEVTDPGHLFHATPESIPAPPAPTDALPEGQKARDRIRKRIYKAQGRQSTIRAGNAFGQFSGQQTQLLGS